MKAKFYEDDSLVGRVTREIRAHGINCLQSHRLAENEDAHVAELLRFFDPVDDACILDLGAGTGGAADIMKKIRPDLKFILLNRSQSQLDMASNRHYKICADFHEIPRLPMPIDAVMMMYALGHGHLRTVMSEIARVLPIGGVFFLYDLTAPRGSAVLRAKFQYTAYPAVRIVQAAHAYGMVLTKTKRPTTVLTEHMAWAGDDLNAAFNTANPTLLRFCKVQ